MCALGCGQGGGLLTQLATDKEYILIVNNDAAMMKALCRLFQRLGQPVAAAWSHRRALEKMRHMPVKLVVADVDMPGLDGLDFFDRAHELRPKAVLIAIGSWRERARKCKLRNGSTVFSLTKPLKKGELLAVTRRAIAGPTRG